LVEYFQLLIAHFFAAFFVNEEAPLLAAREAIAFTVLVANDMV
jgi:hypothetical protein